MEDNIVILSEDKVYGERLLASFQELREEGVQMMLVTKGDRLSELDRDTSCIITKKGQDVSGFSGRILRLVTDKEDKSGIYAFQPSSKIYKQILDQLHNTVCEEGSLVCVFSPEGGSRGTELSLAIAQKEATTRKTLYISLSGFPVLFGSDMTENYESHPGIASIFAEGMGGKSKETIKKMIFNYEGVDVLPPVQHYKDLLDIEISEFETLLSILQKECGYEKIIIELGQLFEYSLDLLEYMDQVIAVSGKDLIARVRMTVLRRYLQMEGKGWIAEQMKVVE